MLALQRWLAPVLQRQDAPQKQIKWTFQPALQDKDDGPSYEDVGAAGREEKQDKNMLQTQRSKSQRKVAKYAATQPEPCLRGIITCAEPHMQLLEGMLEDASVAGAARRYSAMCDGAEPRETQHSVALAATNKRCFDYFKSVSSLLASKDVWMFTGNSQSYGRIGEASRLLTRAVAQVHRDVFCKHRQCPLATFKLLYDK